MELDVWKQAFESSAETVAEKGACLEHGGAQLNIDVWWQDKATEHTYDWL